MFPVVAPPIVKVLFLTDCTVPSPESTRACVPEETEAVGVPELMFNTANLALTVAVPPRRRSWVWFLGWIVPEIVCHRPKACVPESAQLGIPPATVKTWLVVPMVRFVREEGLTEAEYRRSPVAYVVTPVPPKPPLTDVHYHTPVPIVPTEVSEEVRTPVPRVVAERTEVPAI